MSRSLLFPALLLLAATPAVAQQSSRRDRDDEYESRVDTTINFDRRGTVALSLGGGQIIVTSWDRPQVRVRARSERSAIRVDATAGRLTVDIARSRGGESTFEVTVPSGVQVAARATTGDISVTGTKGIVEAGSQSGDITVDDAAERVELRSLSGDITGRNLAGIVEVNSLSGDIDLTGVRGDVEATGVSSDIELRNVTSRYVRAKTTSGEITFDGTIDNTGRYDLGSHSGSLYLVIPQNTGALLTVSTYNGSIDSPDFPITLKPGDHGISSTRRYSFEIGKGDARISAESFSGDITIRSKARLTTDR
jgi:DUF4097 and DUF4098 domain-containing protein YvlB